jgi:formate--tetrahydrofolate ligase
LVHGGPFANIAHGCNSVIATKTAMNLFDYTVTEAGFGSDLGAEKFLDIVCSNSKIKPNVVVLVASIRSLKMHGGLDFKELNKIDMKSLKKGLENLEQHINNIRAFGLPCIVAINKFHTDTKEEIDELLSFSKSQGVDCSISSVFTEGSKGAIDLAKKVVKQCEGSIKFNPAYLLTDKLEDKIHKIVTRCYGAEGVEYSTKAQEKLKELNNTKSYVCMAKTPLTFSDDPKEIIVKKPFKIHVQDLLVVNGANFIVVMSGSIFRMPGLPKVPAAVTNF